jgi:hypothetical protein
MCKDISSGIDQSRLDAKRCENLAKGAPMDSFSNYLKARMSLRREAMWDKEENE